MAVVNDADADAELDESSCDYERTLDDEQLIALAADADRRVKALLAQGVPLPMAQIESHHLIGLLENFIGRPRSLRVREWHLLWLERQLDNVEAEVRAHLISSGIFDGADDLPGFP
jgi:hypothetical protein